MKPAMTILVGVLVAGLALAQSPSVIQNTRATMNGVRDNAAAASNAALGIQDKAPSAAAATHTPVKASAGSAVPVQSSTAVATKPVATKTVVSKTVAVKTKGSGAKSLPVAAVHRTAKPKAVRVAPEESAPVAAPAESSGASASGPDPAGDEGAASQSKWNANGKRDPFISPVVNRTGGSGCSTGKKCLEIGSISLRGVVHAESGFIAVVSNGLNKAYFLRENDPVFNGYVMKITGDSIVFQETVQDRLGKTFTREVVKKITTPAV